MQEFKPAFMNDKEAERLRKVSRYFMTGEEEAVNREMDKEQKKMMARGLVEKGRRKVGRNEPCPCGSGQKFKKCCLRQARRV